MAEVFLQELFRRSIVGGILILAVMLMRLLLQRAPKRVLVYSWSLVGAALIFPVFFKAPGACCLQYCKEVAETL